ncbi:Hypp2264 [Branchiostoma lanceolatum]|uniref:Hypp2264 protein n=1 Tax=Branchiostoma lanceolatum TaxID=7740 RepID=A0A8J9ZS47_BRALA|nr:Hypp2264 [Branchiostoma lanceolatum]
MVGGIRQLWRDFPVKQVSVLGMILTADSFTQSMAAPFLPFLTHDFFPSLKSNQLGYYAGFLMSALFAGTFVGCFMWGKLSDIVGRRPILLSGVTGLMLSILLLGFSFSFVWAISVQFVGGFLNGNLGVAKTYLYEICSPRFHSVAFSIVWIPAAAARFVGPVLGGFLACPATRFHTFAQPFFQQFPYFLPCSVVAGILLCILIGSCIFLGESLHKKPEDDYMTLTPISPQDETEHDREKKHRHQESTCSLLRDRLVLIPCVLYALFALADICASQQLLPLLLVSDSKHGGYNFDAAEISIVMTVTAIYSVAAQATIIPFMASKITYKTLYLSGVVLWAAGVVLLPSMVNITGPIKAQDLSTVLNQTAHLTDFTLNFTSSLPVTDRSSHPTSPAVTEMNETVARTLTGQCRLAGDRRKTAQLPASEVPARVWGPLLLVAMLIEQASCQAYMAAIVMIGNAALLSSRGTVNGIAQTMAALSRLIGPAVSANLFAWTTDNGLPWPLDHHLSFYLLVVICLVMVILCIRLPADSNLSRSAAGNGVQTWPEENSERTEQVDEEGGVEEIQSILDKTCDDKTWINGVDDNDDFETDHLLASNIA